VSVYLVRYTVNMPAVKRSASRKQLRITTDDVVAAAVEIADQDGIDAVTIRRVAEACGLSPMGIYRHVADKDDLLDRMVDVVVTAGLKDLVATGPWDERVKQLFRFARQLNLEHPGVAVLSVLRPTPVTGVARFYSQVLGALGDGGFSGLDAVHAFDTLLMFMFGSVLWEIPRSATVRERLVQVAVGDEAAIQIVERAAELSRRDPTEYFEAGLTTILNGLGSKGPNHNQSSTSRQR
jgi:AcrR family transcriptional regulator